MDIISRKEAIKQGLKYYFTGVPCKFGHVDKRKTSCHRCVSCDHEYYMANTEKFKERNVVRKVTHKDQIAEYATKYWKNNKQKVLKNGKKWRQNNKEYACFDASKRRAAKLKRTPKWLTRVDYEIIQQIYIEAQRLTELTGIEFHVDHIIPLVGKIVSGLHVPSNLQILPFYENLTKSNRFTLHPMSLTNDHL